jgi:trans-aconitate methyltransferase
MPDEVNLWSSAEHALQYLSRIDQIPHRTDGEATLLEFVPKQIASFLDLGCGNGRLLSLVKAHAPHARAMGLDFSPTMLESARRQLPDVELIAHDLDSPLPAIGPFDAVVSSFAIHHLPHARKQTLYREVYLLLQPGGVFCNLEHVSSPTARLHDEFLRAIGRTPQEDDPSNKLLDVETQLRWLREIGFADVDCHWKWRELALLVGRKPA